MEVNINKETKIRITDNRFWAIVYSQDPILNKNSSKDSSHRWEKKPKENSVRIYSNTDQK